MLYIAIGTNDTAKVEVWDVVDKGKIIVRST